MTNTIGLTVNGTCVTVEGSYLEGSLLSYLRDVLRLTGSKNGCAQGHCGACTVIVNGKAQRACLLRVEKLAGARVETIESLARDGRLHPVQQAFMEEGAIQCGFCTPGMVMASKALLDRNPDPTEEEIRCALRDNLCRCTGYVSILRAVKRAAHLLRGPQMEGPMESTSCDVVGKSVVRKDDRDKVTGTLRFAGDLYEPEMLHARALRAAVPHAEVLSIDCAQAKKVPGVVAVLTAKDVPGAKLFGRVYADQPVLALDRVRYVGDAVACVYAETEEAVEQALQKIQVEYAELEVISTPQRALESDAPKIHEKGNLLAEHHVRKGDVDRAFREADVVVENDYFTPSIEHAYMEPESCLASPAQWMAGRSSSPAQPCPVDGKTAGTAGRSGSPQEDGGVTVRVGTQGPYTDRAQIAASLGLPPDKVRLIYTPMGGAFGGKQDITVQLLAALGAQVTGRPVKMVLTRPESIRTSIKRHAEYLHYRTAATRDGKLLAVEATIIGDTGAYASSGAGVLFRSATFATGPYIVPNVKVDAYAVHTNNPPAGAFRGFGTPQVTFASECQMDELAQRLGMDPFELRLRNVLEAGAVTATGDRLTESVGVKECLVAIRDALAKEVLPTPSPGKRIGVGIAAGYKNIGIGPGPEDRAGALAEVDQQGQVTFRVGCVDMGQGHHTSMAQIAAEILGVPYDRIRIVAGDTAICPDSYLTAGSRAVLVQGRAVHMAAGQLRTCVLDFASSQMGMDHDSARLENGVVYDGTARGRVLLSEVADQAAKQGDRLFAEAYYTAPTCYRNLEVDERLRADDPERYRLHFAYSFGAQACIVEVDQASGEVHVLKVITAQDVGRSLHPQIIQGQMEGGAVMGLGAALTEELVLERGYVLSDTLRKLKLPHIGDAPEVLTIAVENPHSEGPHGAKGMAELSNGPTAPAIANAIADAVGIRVRDLPIRPGKILQAMQRAARVS